MVSSMSVPLCNRFHTIRANSRQNNAFVGVPLFDTIIQGESLHDKLGAAHSEDFIIISCTFLIQIQSVTYGQTDRCPDHG